LLAAQVSICVCRTYGAPQLPLSKQRPQPALATVQWVEACVADGVCHQTSSFPHFEPGPGPLPLPDMAGCTVRITALPPNAKESHRQRQRLGELIEVLGAKVAGQGSRWSDLTHVICVQPEHLDRKQYDAAQRKQIPVVTVQWLFDCFSTHARQVEHRYGVERWMQQVESQQAVVSREAPPPQRPAALAQPFAAGVLQGLRVLISPSALGSDARLPSMAEELGGSVRAWRCAEELEKLLLEDAEPMPPSSGASGSSAAAEPRSGAKPSTIVLMEKEEVGKEDGPLASVLGRVPADRRGAFVTPPWLTETYQQRRRLPTDRFAALPAATLGEEGPAKRPRLGSEEASYAWQPAASKSLDQFAEDSRARALETKVQQKVNEGLRLAELRREPSKMGA